MPKDKDTSKKTNVGAIVKDDTGFPDLSKMQMMAWTVIAIGTYVIEVVSAIHGASVTKSTEALKLPDIDSALMVLMGLGQGAYIGKKLVTTAVSRLTGISVGNGKPGTEVTIFGASFGDAKSQKNNGSQLTIDGLPFTAEGLTWDDTKIEFKIPDKQLNGTDWKPAQKIQIGVIVNGQDSANTLSFTVTP